MFREEGFEALEGDAYNAPARWNRQAYSLPGCSIYSVRSMRYEPYSSLEATTPFRPCNLGALIIGIGFWGPFYYKYNKEPPK